MRTLIPIVAVGLALAAGCKETDAPAEAPAAPEKAPATAQAPAAAANDPPAAPAALDDQLRRDHAVKPADQPRP